MRESGANPEWPTFSSFLSKFFRSRNFNKSYNFRTLFSHLFPDFYLPVREGNGGAECKKRREIDLCDGSVQKKLENEGISFSRKTRKQEKKVVRTCGQRTLLCLSFFFFFAPRKREIFALCKVGSTLTFVLANP